MGYFVTGEGSITIPADKLDDAYKALVELNKRDDLKSGGSSRETMKPVRSTSVARYPHKWFSWMDWNYDELNDNAKDILKDVGFEIDEDDDGSIVLRYYDNKIGAEEHFVKAIASHVTEDSIMVWTGEDGEKWRWIFRDGELITQEAIFTWDETD